MVPSLFKCAAEPKKAEIDIANGGCNPQTILEQHWDTFITQEDFQYLASIGINTVRLPIGYWSLPTPFLDGTPFEKFTSIYENAWSYVVRAINMAGAAGIGVLLDLHGAVGSQNGQVRISPSHLPFCTVISQKSNSHTPASLTEIPTCSLMKHTKTRPC